MHRYFIHLAFKGTNYHGWQVQPNCTTLQGEIEEKLGIYFKEKIAIMGAGRTDTGVHANNFYAHFDISKKIDTELAIYRMNRFFPADIAIKNIFPVKENAHARFSAISRTYKYYISKRKDPFNAEFALTLYDNVDFAILQKAAEIIMQYNDFESFSKVHTDVSNFKCSIYKSYWQQKEHLLIYTIKANRFLRNMVRAVVGTLLEVGSGNIDLNKFRKIIESKSREKAGKSVKGKGLFLHDIDYPKDIF